jgi:hypothetical protein
MTENGASLNNAYVITFQILIDGNMNGVRYCDEILQQHFIPFIRDVITFQQDNSHVVMDFLPQQNVKVLPWSAVPLGLSPIEHVKKTIERRYKKS